MKQLLFIATTFFIFNSTFTIASPAPVAKTGQTVSYAAGDDGALQPGVAWPNPRFTDNGNGSVTDNLTGLIWLKNANCFNTQTWDNALAKSSTLASGACGLSDGSKAGDWHLPNRKELMSLVDYGRYSPALPSGHPFTSVQSDNYWSGSTIASTSNYAWFVDVYGGVVYDDYDKSKYNYVWPVRSGQSGAFGSLTNGACGSSNATSSTAIPTGNLCSFGSASTITGNGPWSWTCSGSNGGSTASCSASLAATPINGACGASNGQIFTAAPTTGFCTTGTASTSTGSGPWYWSCAGSNGGTTASCSAYSGAVTTLPGGTSAKVYLGTNDNFTVSNSDATLYGGAGTDSVTITAGMSGVTLDQNIEKINLPGAASSYTFKQTGNKINVYDASGATQIVSVPVQSSGTQLNFSNGAASALLTAGVMTLGGVPISSTTVTALTPILTASTPTATTDSTAKVYLGTNDNFTVSNNGMTLYGGAGNDTVTINAGMSGVILDQNVERINFSGASYSYAFKQTGNKINVYDAAGITLIATVPVQGGGTVLSFSNGTASALLSGGVMTLGGATVGSTVGTVTPTLK